MNQFIIDPQVFYWINVFGILQTVLGVIGGLLMIAFIGFACGFIYNKIEGEYYDNNRRYVKPCKKWMIVFGILGVLFCTAAVFIPGKSTGIEMLVARTATFDNVNWSVQQVKEIVDYIVNAMKGI